MFNRAIKRTNRRSPLIDSNIDKNDAVSINLISKTIKKHHGIITIVNSKKDVTGLSKKFCKPKLAITSAIERNLYC